MEEITDFRAGDTVAWTKSSSDYPASAGWTGKYRLSGAQQIDVTAAASGDDYLFTITAQTSASFTPGFYTFSGWVEKGSGASYERHELWSGLIEILTNLATQTGVQDNRSITRRTLEKIENAIYDYSTNPVDEIEIAGRRIVRPSLADLLKFKNLLTSELAREDAATDLNAGLGRKKLLARMTQW